MQAEPVAGALSHLLLSGLLNNGTGGRDVYGGVLQVVASLRHRSRDIHERGEQAPVGGIDRFTGGTEPDRRGG